MRWRLHHPVVPRNELHVAAAFARALSRVRIAQEILERPEQERTEPAAITIGLPEKISFQNDHEKILGQVLGISYRIAALANKSENRPPINPAELGERLARLPVVAPRVERRENEAPAGRRKTAALARPIGRVFHCHVRAS